MFSSIISYLFIWAFCAVKISEWINAKSMIQNSHIDAHSIFDSRTPELFVCDLILKHRPVMSVYVCHDIGYIKLQISFIQWIGLLFIEHKLTDRDHTFFSLLKKIKLNSIKNNVTTCSNKNLSWLIYIYIYIYKTPCLTFKIYLHYTNDFWLNVFIVTCLTVQKYDDIVHLVCIRQTEFTKFTELSIWNQYIKTLICVTVFYTGIFLVTTSPSIPPYIYIWTKPFGVYSLQKVTIAYSFNHITI